MRREEQVWAQCLARRLIDGDGWIKANYIIWL